MPNKQPINVSVRRGSDLVEVIVSSDDDGLHVSVSVNGEVYVEPPVTEGDGSAPPPGNGDGGNGG